MNLRDGEGEEEVEFRSRVGSRDRRTGVEAGVEVLGLAGMTQDLLLEAVVFLLSNWFCCSVSRCMSLCRELRAAVSLDTALL